MSDVTQILTATEQGDPRAAEQLLARAEDGQTCVGLRQSMK
jgi:hypothetical protein